VIGLAAFGPFPQWSKLVNVVTGTTAIMYAFAPVSLAALRRRDPDRPRTYVMPLSSILTPAAFCFASLLLYWGGFQTLWKIDLALILGVVLFAIGVAVVKTDWRHMIRPALWILPWLAGMTLIAAFGRYTSESNGVSDRTIIGNWWDLLIIIAFSLVIFYYAVSVASSTERVKELVEVDHDQLVLEPELV
jgi:amino acid transporter